MLMTKHLPCGPSIIIDITKQTPTDEIKAKIEVATGDPPSIHHLIFENDGLVANYEPLSMHKTLPYALKFAINRRYSCQISKDNVVEH